MRRRWLHVAALVASAVAIVAVLAPWHDLRDSGFGEATLGSLEHLFDFTTARWGQYLVAGVGPVFLVIAIIDLVIAIRWRRYAAA